MAREWKPSDFESLYERFICREEYQFGGRTYYLTQRPRYKECMRRYAALAAPRVLDVLDVGGGQLALLAAKLWNDHGAVADLPGPHLEYIASLGINAIHWNLCKSELPSDAKFDFIFFSEVIEHLPIPGYIALERLRRVLRPGGIILCTTPNLYRPRNLLYMAAGHPIFDNFRYPDDDVALGHVLEYSRSHLDWQFKKAGFVQCRVDSTQMHHLPVKALLRPLGWLAYPLHIVPHWRDYLVATAYAPTEPGCDDA
jgi:SAM-dependent methyltransferase